ncbi:hypothetical protein GGTG_13285 [Gaeumannomyces tritici R3-111a-1]|uniref:Uncharacterized protein n=1 Tax=Gaeumannomyces tritici (strain R3-111a-1) TaxID=644352 RepID=J3PIF7_GAET3|nr:hypothetical protein GGTG_13285 [Gaeumannomyces tritici R3-111a-1]EJT69176.1 hypothetical protein GGTG_13285 [Gaeumannomyces tritici R3-111a-1]
MAGKISDDTTTQVSEAPRICRKPPRKYRDPQTGQQISTQGPFLPAFVAENGIRHDPAQTGMHADYAAFSAPFID